MPIAMANFQFKIISKILVDKLATISPKIISTHRRGFIRGRSIVDCICLASKATNLLKNISFGREVSHQI